MIDTVAGCGAVEVGAIGDREQAAAYMPTARISLVLASVSKGK